MRLVPLELYSIIERNTVRRLSQRLQNGARPHTQPHSEESDVRTRPMEGLERGQTRAIGEVPSIVRHPHYRGVQVLPRKKPARYRTRAPYNPHNIGPPTTVHRYPRLSRCFLVFSAVRCCCWCSRWRYFSLALFCCRHLDAFTFKSRTDTLLKIWHVLVKSERLE